MGLKYVFKCFEIFLIEFKVLSIGVIYGYSDVGVVGKGGEDGSLWGKSVIID